MQSIIISGHLFPSFFNETHMTFGHITKDDENTPHKRPAILLFLILFLFDINIWAGHLAKGGMDDHLRPFSNGEKLVYDVSWLGINAGTASLEIMEKFKINGREAYHIVSRARSNAFVSLFYPVDDLIETFVDTEWIYPYKILIQKKEGRRKKDKEIIFDQTGHTVKEIKNGKEMTSEIPPEVQDPLSCLYFFRTIKGLDDGKTFVIDVYDSRKTWQMKVKVIGREVITTPAGGFNTIKVKPEIYYEGLFQNKGEVYVWLTDDERRIPVLVKSSISIGPIRAALVSVMDGDKVAEKLPNQIISPNPKIYP